MDQHCRGLCDSALLLSMAFDLFLKGKIGPEGLIEERFKLCCSAVRPAKQPASMQIFQIEPDGMHRNT
jgi:hypothetical protein